MSYIIIRDDVLWAKHIEGDPELAAEILGMPENASIRLLIEGTPVSFVKMRNGSDGRTTPGLRPDDPEARRLWRALQDRRGERVAIARGNDAARDGYLSSLTTLLSEWDSPEDAAAYDRL